MHYNFLKLDKHYFIFYMKDCTTLYLHGLDMSEYPFGLFMCSNLDLN